MESTIKYEFLSFSRTIVERWKWARNGVCSDVNDETPRQKNTLSKGASRRFAVTNPPISTYSFVSHRFSRFPLPSRGISFFHDFPLFRLYGTLSLFIFLRGWYDAITGENVKTFCADEAVSIIAASSILKQHAPIPFFVVYRLPSALFALDRWIFSDNFEILPRVLFLTTIRISMRPLTLIKIHTNYWWWISSDSSCFPSKRQLNITFYRSFN